MHTSITSDAFGRKTGITDRDMGAWQYRSGSPKTSYRYTGQRWDSGTGLYWYRSRWYDPEIGRFLQPDTIVPNPGDPQSLNRYAYVRNNPLRYTDPSGRFSEDELLKWNVFIGPRQLAGVRDNPRLSWWYYLLRAAEFGDKFSFYAFHLGDREGRFILNDHQLQFEDTEGVRYLVKWEGFQIGDQAVSQRLPLFWRLHKPTGQTLSTEQQLRTYVNGPNNYLSPDYYEFTVGGYFGIGGNVSIKRDRFGTWYTSLQGGFGLGKWGLGLTSGKLIQSSQSDEAQIRHVSEGWGMGFSAAYALAVSIPIVNEGPQPIQIGLSTPGITYTFGYSWSW